MKYPQIKATNIPLNNAKLLVLTFYVCTLIIFGFCLDTPLEIWQGLGKIITSPDTLITDYMGLGGRGAALVNSGLLSLIVLIIFRYLKLQINGFSIACLFTVAGFGLFGKNIFNVWLIVIGVCIYANKQNKKLSEVIYGALFGTALAPVSTEIFFSSQSSGWVKIPLGIFISLLIGFILIPISANLLKVHKGFNLYNMGFTAGIVGTIFVSVLNSFGVIPIPQMIWTTGNNNLFTVYLFFLFSSMIVIGFCWEKQPWLKLKQIWQSSGQLVTDFVLLSGFGASLINMGMTGLMASFYVLLVGADLNGPTIGGIFTVVGFSALGKHPKNILPILVGVYLACLSKTVNANDPSMILAALFGTTLAPIAGKYGWFWGIIAGFIHSSVVQHVGILHGGLNLYNNGFAAGIVAVVLIPVIEIFKPDQAIDK
jgi:hypothetical protein